MGKTLRFVDLFAGLGGFHVALERFGHKCVFAAEINPVLQDLYEANFGIRPGSDIRFCWKDVPAHDVLCAGFPCQPFSKAGTQKGFECPDSGDLFDFILKVVDDHSPTYLLFENVPNILRHAAGDTWTRIRTSLTARGYTVDCKEISPHEVGIPQIRYRAIIVAAKGGLDHFAWPDLNRDGEPLHINTVLDEAPSDAQSLPTQYTAYLDAWEDFLDRTRDVEHLPSFPIWAMEFGADYPIESRAPCEYDFRYLARFKGMFGKSLRGLSAGDQIDRLPSYVASEKNPLPRWKKRFIQQNRAFYLANRDKLESWLPTIEAFPASFQKLEWNCKGASRTVWDKIIQFRASGIRLKVATHSPSLVALTTSQVPVIAWERRYMTVRECARLQSLDGLPQLPVTKTGAFKALGNAVNADVMAMVAERLFAAVPVETFQPNPESPARAVA